MVNGNTKIAGDIVFDTSMLFLTGGALVALIIGVWMVVHANSLFNLNNYLNRWYSTRQMSRPLTKPIQAEPFIYKYHKSIGAFILIGSGYVFYQLAIRSEISTVQRLLLGPEYQTHSLNWVVSAVLLALMIGSIATFIVGAYLFIRPSLLKGVEAWGNRWMTMRKSTKFLDIMREGPEPFIVNHPRAVGGIIVAGSLYILAMLWHYWN